MNQPKLKSTRVPINIKIEDINELPYQELLNLQDFLNGRIKLIQARIESIQQEEYLNRLSFLRSVVLEMKWLNYEDLAIKLKISVSTLNDIKKGIRVKSSTITRIYQNLLEYMECDNDMNLIYKINQTNAAYTRTETERIQELKDYLKTISYKDFVSITGMSADTYHNILSGGRKISDKTIAKLHSSLVASHKK